MTLSEHRGNVFFTQGDPYYAHCIASDLRMGAGIAVEFQHRFGLRGKLLDSGKILRSPTCVLIRKVFNLITKRSSSGKPSYNSIRMAIRKMGELIGEHGVERIAMPRIGCGLDGLSWAVVRQILLEELGKTGITIEVYKL